LAGALGAAGCEPTIPANYPAPPAVEVGSTAGNFAPLVDGAMVTINHGFQGGYHVWGAVRAVDLDPRQLRARFSLGLDDGSPPLAVRDDVFDLDGTGDGLTPGTHVGTTVFLPDPALVRGLACRLSVALTDREGRSGSDSHRVVPADPSP